MTPGGRTTRGHMACPRHAVRPLMSDPLPGARSAPGAAPKAPPGGLTLGGGRHDVGMPCAPWWCDPLKSSPSRAGGPGFFTAYPHESGNVLQFHTLPCKGALLYVAALFGSEEPPGGAKAQPCSEKQCIERLTGSIVLQIGAVEGAYTRREVVVGAHPAQSPQLWPDCV